MLLRESSQAMRVEGGTDGAVEAPPLDATLEATVGRGGDGGVPHGEAIVRFGESVTRGTDDLPEAREALIDALGPAGFAEACSIVGIFNGLVRIADASGIPLDEGTLSASRDFRGALGLEQFPSAANTPLGQAGQAGQTGDSQGAAGEPGDVAKLFQ